MGRNQHSTALWASLTALFTNLAAVNVIALIGGPDPDQGTTAIAAAITSLFVAASVYAKLRWDAAKAPAPRRRPPRARAPDEPPEPPAPPAPPAPPEPPAPEPPAADA